VATCAVGLVVVILPAVPATAVAAEGRMAVAAMCWRRATTKRESAAAKRRAEEAKQRPREETEQRSA